ncbi:MAG: DNA repair protein RadC [Verrucomicrobiales bacterium]
MGIEEHRHNTAGVLADLAGREAADHLLKQFQSLTDLSRASFDDLTQIKGVGPSRAKAIRNAFLLAQELAMEKRKDYPVLDTPERVAECFREEFRSYNTERFKVVCLNTRRHIINVHEIAVGTLDTVLVHPREVFRPAISSNSAAILVLHNHPSGDPTPSDADVRVTRDLIRAGQLLKIELLDHVVLGIPSPQQPRGYSSLRELGYWAGP